MSSRPADFSSSGRSTDRFPDSRVQQLRLPPQSVEAEQAAFDDALRHRLGHVGLPLAAAAAQAGEHLGDVGHAHRRAGMPAFRFLHGVHAEGTDRVGEFETAGHAGLLQAAGA